jgi:hypothetical protein
MKSGRLERVSGVRKLEKFYDSRRKSGHPGHVSGVRKLEKFYDSRGKSGHPGHVSGVRKLEKLYRSRGFVGAWDAQKIGSRELLKNWKCHCVQNCLEIQEMR